MSHVTIFEEKEEEPNMIGKETFIQRVADEFPLMLPLDISFTQFEGFVACAQGIEVGVCAKLILKSSNRLVRSNDKSQASGCEAYQELCWEVRQSSSKNFGTNLQRFLPWIVQAVTFSVRQLGEDESDPSKPSDCVSSYLKADSDFFIETKLCEALESFRNSIEKILEINHPLNTKSKRSVTDTKMISSLLNELDEIGWDNLCSVQELNIVKLKKRDAKGRIHFIELNLNNLSRNTIVQQNKDTDSSPIAFKVCLPMQFRIDVSALPSKNAKYIKFIYEKFCAEVDIYQNVWDELDELDQNAWIMVGYQKCLL